MVASQWPADLLLGAVSLLLLQPYSGLSLCAGCGDAVGMHEVTVAFGAACLQIWL